MVLNQQTMLGKKLGTMGESQEFSQEHDEEGESQEFSQENDEEGEEEEE